MTQGQIGYMFQNSLKNHSQKEGVSIGAGVCTVVTQVEVKKDDPDFQDPSKPVGPFYIEEEALRLRDEKGYKVKKVKPSGEKVWRRVVPSPEPLQIMEQKLIKTLLDADTVVIASGGGGIPVAFREDGTLEGVKNYSLIA
jgi:carbamate kinase